MDFKKWDIKSYYGKLHNKRSSLAQLLFGQKQIDSDRTVEAIFKLPSSAHPKKEISPDDQKDGPKASESPSSTELTSFQSFAVKASILERLFSKIHPNAAVLMRCLFSIFGVVLFLRLTTVFGSVGIVFGPLLVLLCGGLAFLTTLSISAIITNGKIEQGGIYFLVSRALGPKFGFIIGVLFSLANTVSVAFYVLGLAEIIALIFSVTFRFYNQTVAASAVFVIFIFCVFGPKVIVFMQVLFGLLALLVAITSVYIGFIYRGVTGGNSIFAGFSKKIVNDNLIVPSLQTFFKALATFFPGTMGMIAAAHSVDKIKNPEKSFFRGTLISISFSLFIYISIGILSCLCISNTVLKSTPLLLADISLVNWLVYIGAISSTFSHSFSNFARASEIIQRIAEDDLVKVTRIFTGRYSHIKALSCTLVLTLLFILPGNLDKIAAIITSFVIITYSVVNFACFLQSFQKTPNWRPTFKFYNAYVSLFTACFYIVLMFFLNYVSAVLAVLISVALATVSSVVEPKDKWGGAMSAVTFITAVKTLKSLEKSHFDIKDYRIQLLVLCKRDESYLEKIALKLFKSGNGIFIFAHVIVEPLASKSWHSHKRGVKERDKWLEKKSIRKNLKTAVISTSFPQGVYYLSQCVGVSKVRPNTVLIGYKENWQTKAKEIASYVKAIQNALLCNLGLIVVRNFHSFNFSVSYKEAILDIWWLEDDGGLSVLIPYVISLSSMFERPKLRVMEISHHKSIHKKAKNVKVSLANLLIDLRIPASVLNVEIHIDSATVFASETFKLYSVLVDLSPEEMVLDSKTLRFLSYAEKIKEKAKESFINFISCPVPVINSNVKKYMALLECMTKDAGNVFLIRGNGESVISGQL